MQNRAITQQLVHITYRLYGSLTTAQLQKIKQTKARRIRLNLDQYHALYPDTRFDNRLDFLADLEEIDRSTYLQYDSMLDTQMHGPMFLEDPEAKNIIINSWLHIAQHDDLTVYVVCVMSNHVHVVLRANHPNSEIDFKEVMEKHKHFTGWRINKRQRCVGRRVWAEKAFDRDVRPGRFMQVLWYVINNPKKAGITDDPLSYCGLYFDPRLEEEYIAPYRRVV